MARADVTTNVLILGASAEDPPPGLPASLDGASLAFASDAAELAANLPQADVIFHWSNRTALLRSAWPQARQLRWIHAAGVGVEWTIFPELIESDVVLTNCRGVFDVTVPEYVLGLMLLMAKDFRGTLEAQRDRRWHHRPVEAVGGSRAIVVGAGSIGRATARLLRSLGLDVVLVARRASSDPEFGDIAPVTELSSVAAGADWLIVVLPLTAETRGLIGPEVLDVLPPTARVINVGRGPVINDPALIDRLSSGRLAGAALDVFEREPLPPEHPYWTLPNVIVYPHMAGDVHGWLEWFTRSFLANLDRWLADKPLENVVDKRLGYVSVSTGPDRTGEDPA
jgi:phosphoglycerate dehydrogenase-like enzyme